MKNFLIAVLILFSSHAFANEEIIALTKIHLTENGRLLGAHWFDGSKIGVINMGLEWVHSSADVQTGFKLGEAGAVQFIEPALPQGCTVKSFKGDLTWLENGVSTLSATLSGDTCKEIFEVIAQSAFDISFTDVPHLIGSSMTKTLRLRVPGAL